MSASWFMSTVVCDDIRREEGNKLSYMGIYGGNIIVPGFPLTLPKLCFVMSVMEVGTQSPPASLTFRVLRDEEVLAEVSLSHEALVGGAAHAESQRDRDSKRLTVGTVLQIFPLQLVGPCVLKARAVLDGGEEIKGGSWPVESIGQ
jgi:hypothetical protein